MRDISNPGTHDSVPRTHPPRREPSRCTRSLRSRSRTALAAGARALLFIVALSSPAAARTVRVPADQPTLQAAVAAAATGDTVMFAPGVHTGGAWINGKALTFASWFVLTGDTALIAQTVIDGVAPGVCGGALGCVGNAVLEFGDNARGSAVVGLTVTRGENGVSSASTVDIVRCRVIANGDGVDFVPGAGGTLRNSLFANNSDDGIDLNGRMNIAIIDNVIRDSADDGIEFRLYPYSGPTVLRLEVIGGP